MSYVLVFMSAFAITGFPNREACMAAREAVVQQFGRNLDAGAICIVVPKDGEVVGRGSGTRPGERDAD